MLAPPPPPHLLGFAPQSEWLPNIEKSYQKRPIMMAVSMYILIALSSFAKDCESKQLPEEFLILTKNKITPLSTEGALFH